MSQHMEYRPRYFSLAKNPGCAKSNPFTKARTEAHELGLTLERVKGGYNLTGDLDLGPGGVDCRTLEDVQEELDNYR